MALTKVTGQVINSTTDLSVGVATVGGGTSTGDLYVVGVSTFSGDVSVGGTLTYEDVTNVDAVGLITARKGITVTANGLYVNAGISTFNADVKVGSGITLSKDGDIFATGVCTATSFVGSGANLTGLVSVANQSNDRLVTCTGSADALNGEANLTMTGNVLTFNTTANSHRIQNVATGDHYTELRFDSNRSSADVALAAMTYYWDGDQVADIIAQSGSDTTNKDDGHLIFRTSASQGAIGERLRITSSGSIGINQTSPQRILHIGTSGTAEANIRLQGGADYYEFRVKDSDNALSIHKNIAGAGSAQAFKIDSDGATELTPSKNSGNNGFTVTPSDGTTASSFQVLGNNNAGADGRNGCATFIDVNYYVATSTIFSLAGRGTNVYEVLGNGNHKIGGTGGTAAVSQTRNLNIGSNSEANLAIETHNDSTSESSNIRFYKSGNTGASPQIVEANDMIAQLMAYGHDGTDYANQAAGIKFKVDGTPGSNNMPGAIQFLTNNGTGGVGNRFNISATGNIGWMGDATASSAIQQRKRFSTVSHSAHNTYDVTLCSDFGNNDVLKLEYAFCWNDGDGGAWGTAICWKHHDGNTEVRYLGEEIASPPQSFSIVFSGNDVIARIVYAGAGMNGYRMLNVECGGQCTPAAF